MKKISQEKIAAMVADKEKSEFVRAAERSAIIVTELNQSEVQEFINSDLVQLGSFDKTSYEKSGYFDENGLIKVGMAVMVNAKDDIYINPEFEHNGEVGPDNKFQDLPFSHLIKSYAINEKREMVAAKEVFDEIVEIEAPWGGTQELRQDGWLNIGWNEIYVINSDDKGLPAGGFEKAYVPSY